MAELTPRERLQPSLLDRLTDNEPHESVESREQRVLSWARLRECVVRDLNWLFNCDNLSLRQRSSECPDAMRSVINYGIPSFAGSTTWGRDIDALEKDILAAIHIYEPRLLRDSVSVRLLPSDSEMNSNTLKFRIEADLWAHPLPLHLYLQTEVDLDTGDFTATPCSS